MYYSPLEQFEPIPYFIPFKLGFFYIFGTNVTYILILLLGIFFFINGSFWSIMSVKKINENLYNYVFNINSSENMISFFKLASLPLNYTIFFYKNAVFTHFFHGSNSFFNTISFQISVLVVNYKKNLFKALTNYSISNNFSIMYHFILTKTMGNVSLFALPYNFYVIKSQQSNQSSNYFLYFLRVFFFFTFFFKKLISNLYNIILIQIYNFGLNTVVTTFSSSDLKKSLKYFPFFFINVFFYISLKYYWYYTL